MRKIEPITAGQLAEFTGRLVRSLEENGVDRHQFQVEFVQGSVINNLLKLMTPDWLRSTLERERQCHLDFFGQEFNLSSFKTVLMNHGQEAVSRWNELGLEPHYLPSVAMSQDAEFQGWKVKPEKWYYQKVAEGNVLRQQPDGTLKIDTIDTEAHKLEGITVLVDTHLKPAYNNGNQMFENDNLLGPIIQQLREKKEIARYEYGPQSSRFGISAEEWEMYVKPALADFLKIQDSQVRLERAIEANVIPQLYPHMPRQKDGETSTWVWYEEYFVDASYRLVGGSSRLSGLAYVNDGPVGNHWFVRAVRPLVVLEN